MAMTSTNFAAGLTLKEQLFYELIGGSFVGHEALLEELYDVDVRIMGQGTLLHLAVRLGKLDWVEALLGKGADPDIREEGADFGVLKMASDACKKHPEDRDREVILRLVQLASRLRVIRAVRDDGGDDVGNHGGGETNKPKGDELMRLQLCSVRESLDLLTDEMTSRDAILQKVEEGVTSQTEMLGQLSDTVERVTRDIVGTGPLERVRGGHCENMRVVVPPKVLADAMMRISHIVNENNIKSRTLHSYYEKLATTDEVTSLILSSLLRPNVQAEVHVDFDSHYIKRMKPRISDHCGMYQDTSQVFSWADLEDSKIYLGAKRESSGRSEMRVLAELVEVLTEVSLVHAFKNGGRPYAEGDTQHKSAFNQILETVESRYLEETFDKWILNTLGRNTRLDKESQLISAVPAIIAEWGSTLGRSRLQAQLPLLLYYYEHHVMVTLLNLML